MGDHQLILGVGQDVESWDFVVTLPSALLAEIQAQLANIDGDDWG